MEQAKIFSFLKEAFLRLFFPSLCALCEKMLGIEEYALCQGCKNNLNQFRLSPRHEKIRNACSLFSYEGPVKTILHQIKFEKRRRLIRLFIPQLQALLDRHSLPPQCEVIIPVPLDPRRKLDREFNPAGIVADLVSRLSYSGRGQKTKVLKRLLLKKNSTPSQSLLGKGGRSINLRGAFRVTRPSQIRGRSVLLIDDIFTTGATLEEVAKTLKEAGASEIHYLSLARTP